MKRLLWTLLLCIIYSSGLSQEFFEVKGFCISAPSTNKVGEFVDFIRNDLAANGINTLVLRVDYNYAYESRPELRDENPMTKIQVKQLVSLCK